MYLGIDPGISGSWAVVSNNLGEVINYGPDVHSFLQFSGANVIKIAYLENQQLRHSDKNQGKMFNLQKLLVNFGQWQGVLITLGIEYKLIPPLTWMARWGCAGRMPAEHRKRQYLSVAKTLWPDRKWKAGDHNLAAAALLAMMARDDNKMLGGLK